MDSPLAEGDGQLPFILGYGVEHELTVSELERAPAVVRLDR